MTREEAIKIIRKMLAYTDLTVRANLNADMVSACNLAIKALEQESVLEIKTVTNAEEAEAYPISKNITKGFEEFTKMMFKQGLVESENKE